VRESACELVVPDAGLLITLAYADRLDLLLALGIKVVVVDMVTVELTRHLTPTSEKILAFLAGSNIRVIETEIGKEAVTQGSAFKKRYAGERAIQDFLFQFSDEAEQQGQPRYALLLFEDHKIAGTSFVLPDNVYVISTMAFLRKLEEMRVIASAIDVRDAAVKAGREFSQLDVSHPPKSNPAIKPL